MDSRVTIALDAMGGDFGTGVVVPAAILAARKNPDVDFILVGDEAEIQTALGRAGAAGDSQLRVQHASQTVAMDELPSHALRNKKDSSMRIAINQIKEGKAHALSLIHISEPTRPPLLSRMPSSA